MSKSIQTILKTICNTEIWWVASAVAAGMLQAEWLPLAVLLAVLFWGIRWLAYGKPSQRTPVDLGVILLVSVIPVTLWATTLPEKTTTQVYRLILGILLFYALINWTQNKRRLVLTGLGLLLVGLILAGGALVSVQWATAKLPFIPAEVYQRFTLLVSDTVNPNVLAGSMVLILPFALALLFFWKGQTWIMRGMAMFTLLVCTGILILTQSRSALIALGIAAGVIVVLRWRWGWLLACVAALVGVVVHEMGYFPSQAILNSAVQEIFGAISLDNRIELWSRAIYAIQDFPFTGVGMGSYPEVVDLLYPTFLLGPGKAAHAHNIFLQIAVDLGIPGLIAWLSILIGVSAAAWQLYKSGKAQQDGWAAGLGAGLLSSQVALIVHGLTDAVTWGMVRSAPLVWGIWGFTIAAWLVLVASKIRHT